MRQLKRLASSPYFKAFAGTATLGGLGYAAFYHTSKTAAEVVTRKIIEEDQEAQAKKNLLVQEAAASKK